MILLWICRRSPWRWALPSGAASAGNQDGADRGEAGGSDPRGDCRVGGPEIGDAIA